jgi:hypothetical protein
MIAARKPIHLTVAKAREHRRRPGLQSLNPSLRRDQKGAIDSFRIDSCGSGTRKSLDQPVFSRIRLCEDSAVTIVYSLPE